MTTESQYLTFYLTAAEMFALSVTVYEIFPVKICVTTTLGLEWAKVRYKYANRNQTFDFLFDGDSNVCSATIY